MSKKVKELGLEELIHNQMNENLIEIYTPETDLMCNELKPLRRKISEFISRNVYSIEFIYEISYSLNIKEI